MARLPVRAGAWTLLAWAAATVVLRPATRMVAEAHGFAATLLLAVDIAFVVYALASAFVVLMHLRRGKPVRILAWLTAPPLAFELLRGGEAFEAFWLDLSGYPLDLAVLHWLGNLAFLALLASVVLLLLSKPAQEPVAGPV